MMQLETVLSLIIAGIGCVLAVSGWIGKGKRQVKTDTKEDATTITTISVKLDNIAQNLAEMKADNAGVRKDVREAWERQIAQAEQIKTLFSRIEALERRE